MAHTVQSRAATTQQALQGIVPCGTWQASHTVRPVRRLHLRLIKYRHRVTVQYLGTVNKKYRTVTELNPKDSSIYRKLALRALYDYEVVACLYERLYMFFIFCS